MNVLLLAKFGYVKSTLQSHLIHDRVALSHSALVDRFIVYQRR